MSDYRIEKENEIFEASKGLIESYYYKNEDCERELATGYCKFQMRVLRIDWEHRLAHFRTVNVKTDEVKIFEIRFSIDYVFEIQQVFEGSKQ